MTVEPLDEAAIRAAVKAAETAAAAGKGVAHLDEIALFDLAEYFHKNFGSRIGTLSRADYWEALVQHGGRLGLRDRAALFSLLWGRLDSFTEMFVALVGALDGIGHATEAQAAASALIPREIGSVPNSIIDVAVLARLGTEPDKADTIPLVPVTAGKAGAPTALPRATLTALIAEVSLVIAEEPWPFFEHTDLLDFPGARSRLKLTNLPEPPNERSAQTRELFLRGKIAYLFQRYTDELELTSMLLCMPPSVAEVKDLAGMVRSWIAATHGATPERRKTVRNALFLVLTKHDLEFQEKGGETPESRTGKWDRRLHASLLELYGKDGWPKDWDGKPFDNALFLRNPGMKQVHLMDYEDVATLKEFGPAKGSAARDRRVSQRLHELRPRGQALRAPGGGLGGGDDAQRRRRALPGRPAGRGAGPEPEAPAGGRAPGRGRLGAGAAAARASTSPRATRRAASVTWRCRSCGASCMPASRARISATSPMSWTGSWCASRTCAGCSTPWRPCARISLPPARPPHRSPPPSTTTPGPSPWPRRATPRPQRHPSARSGPRCSRAGC